MEDALHATRAAVEEGILPGGGVALLRCIEAAQSAKARGDEKIGVQIVARALEAPIRQIAGNCGQDGSVIADEVRQLETNQGFDANTGEFGAQRFFILENPDSRRELKQEGQIAERILLREILVDLGPVYRGRSCRRGRFQECR